MVGAGEEARAQGGVRALPPRAAPAERGGRGPRAARSGSPPRRFTGRWCLSSNFRRGCRINGAPPRPLDLRALPDPCTAAKQHCGRVEDGRGSLGPMANAPFPIPAHRHGHADFRHPACMGLSLSRVSRHFCRPLSFHSFVRPAPRAFFRPDRIFPSPSRAAAVKDGASSAPPKACPCRVGRGVATPTPHRPGCADFQRPVLHGRVSLTPA
jgi:hypothetical protein